jgi:predicted RNA-binding protein with EMAP domain
VTVKHLDTRDQLTVVLLTARKFGIKVSEGQFRGPDLGRDIRDVRESLQALEGQLARLEEQARREVPR